MDRIRVDEQRHLGPPQSRDGRTQRPRNARSHVYGPSRGSPSIRSGTGSQRWWCLARSSFSRRLPSCSPACVPGCRFPNGFRANEVRVERVVRSDVASVSFITVLITTASVVVLVYEVFRILGPGPSNCPVPRVEGARLLDRHHLFRSGSCGGSLQPRTLVAPRRQRLARALGRTALRSPLEPRIPLHRRRPHPRRRHIRLRL